jgi:hypothetical protein
MPLRRQCGGDGRCAIRMGVDGVYEDASLSMLPTLDGFCGHVNLNTA